MTGPLGVPGRRGTADAAAAGIAPRWGEPPWTIDFRPAPHELPESVDFAVVGGGFTGLATAAWLRHAAPNRTVALFEASTIGAGSSGRSGGMVLAESSAGDLPGLGDVLGGFSDVLRTLGVDCDLLLPGAWEIGRRNPLPNSPICWNDSGKLRAVAEVPGGSLDPGKLVSGLARAAEARSVLIFENAPVANIGSGETLWLDVRGKRVVSGQVLLATNAQSLEMSALDMTAHPMFTLAAATEPLTVEQLESLGLTSRRPFYTVDFPYLWGRLLGNGGVVFGSGLVRVNDWRELATLDVASGEAAELIANLQRRVRGLAPAMKSVRFTHCWGGPMAATGAWTPVFRHHPRSSRMLVLGAYAGQGVALSSYLGRWAAEAMLGRREPPRWESG